MIRLRNAISLATVAFTGGYLMLPDKNKPWMPRIHWAECRGRTGESSDDVIVSMFTDAVRKPTIDSIPNGFDINARFPLGGWTLLHTAAINGKVGLTSFLIEHGADVNAQEKRPLLKSGQIGYYRAIKERFLSRLIEPSALTDGFTPLHYAVINGNEEVVRMLLDHGADPTIQCSLGYRPKDYFDADVQPPSLLKVLQDGELRAEEEKKRVEKELRKKYPLEKQLRETIVGQTGPINSVGSAIRRKENGWHDEGRPLVFLFLGSSGIGKTELAKQLAKYIHKDDMSGFIRIDMSEFQSKHEVAKFIGSPPGYVGYDEGGQLTKRLTEKPNAVVLLDEVEKAHIDVLTIMLQVFDEGRLTDGKGTTIDCRDAIFIMTSNLAQTEIADESESLRRDVDDKGGFAFSDESKSLSKKFINETIYPILRHHFKRDEFLGRINEILFFLPFNQQELEAIVEMEMNKWGKRANEKHKMSLSWSPEVVSKLTEGYNIRYGARSIKYEVEKRIVNQIAKAHELDEIGEGSNIQLFLDPDGNIKLKFTKPDKKFSFW